MARVRQARQKGVREKPTAESLSSDPPAPNLADMGWRATRTHTIGAGDSLVGDGGREATVKVCGVAVAMLQGHSWAPTLSRVQA